MAPHALRLEVERKAQEVAPWEASSGSRATLKQLRQSEAQSIEIFGLDADGLLQFGVGDRVGYFAKRRREFFNLAILQPVNGQKTSLSGQS
ncbi:MAG: hypothetical protein ACLQU1_20445 [Bryobacteraceae bacterium]